MKRKTYSKYYLNIIVAGILLSFVLSLLMCTPDPKGKPSESSSTTTEKPKLTVPTFNADSAYQYIQKQVDFGPRMPGTEAHKACAVWLEETLKQFSKEVIVQKGEVTAYTKEKLPMYNVIASFNPDNKERILLCAHWDTRHIADQDEERKDEPILGANDGGSGVGVLIEVARQLQANPIDIGVDIVLFDVEDYGSSDIDDSYGLGSQYWSKKPHKPNYKANFGILLDMVGASDAIFYQERYSLEYASPIVKKVWLTALELGHGSYFVNKVGAPITDDHYYVNTLANIPTIDILHYVPEEGMGFGKFWHTHDDNMDVISKNTLQAVGDVVLNVLYKEDANF